MDPAQLMQTMVAQINLTDELRKSKQLSELKLDGITLPNYGGTLKELFQLYRGSLKLGAAQWYIVKKDDVKSVEDFFAKPEEAFVPTALQERLRDHMNDLKERNCKDLPDYITSSGT
ncbi:hypothetical protein PHMEG_00026643 [Phytophthora megakarya]|uniref:Uncharacterized protein n=1 Tax=Phytophthora megakarya TaxID=4795 RepID=A0A225VAT5_9STRA|nr:hypothetical protein PHMEG_00026643 [Phytophthora megakarya]